MSTSSTELAARVADLRLRGLTPKEIARTLGLKPSQVVPLLRAGAQAATSTGTEMPLVGAWISRGWSTDLSWTGHPDWHDDAIDANGVHGLVAAVVARENRFGKISACTYLVDAYCLGVKNVLGPSTFTADRLRDFLMTSYAGFEGDYVAAPLDLVQHIVLGAVEFARQLGFEPHKDFAAGRGHLGAWGGPSDIRFGKDGKVFYIQGPDDDASSILATLAGNRGGFR